MSMPFSMIFPVLQVLSANGLMMPPAALHARKSKTALSTADVPSFPPTAEILRNHSAASAEIMSK
jgi:hypothetical protein